ncbi:hypothetical protein QTP88_013146 [Uroleucon formosanum]
MKKSSPKPNAIYLRTIMQVQVWQNIFLLFLSVNFFFFLVTLFLYLRATISFHCPAEKNLVFLEAKTETKPLSLVNRDALQINFSPQHKLYIIIEIQNKNFRFGNVLVRSKVISGNLDFAQTNIGHITLAIQARLDDCV